MHEGLEPARFVRRRALPRAGQAEVAAPLVVRTRAVSIGHFLDQAVREQAAQGAIEIAWHDAIEAASLLHVANESPPVALAVHERQQHLEHQRFERLWRRLIRTLRHGHEATIDLILVSIRRYLAASIIEPSMGEFPP